VIIELLSAQQCAAMIDELRHASGAAATVYGRNPRGSVDPLVRKAKRVEPSEATRELVHQALTSAIPRLSEQFAVPLTTLEEPQFLRYESGDYFVAHQDGNTGMLRSEREERKVSAVVFLNSRSETPGPDAYGGGSLLFHPRGASEPFRLTAEAGTLVAFRAETTHEVEPVSHGERFTIATWFR